MFEEAELFTPSGAALSTEKGTAECISQKHMEEDPGEPEEQPE